MKTKRSHYILALTLLASLASCGGNNFAKAQNLPGTKDLSVNRLDWIVDQII